MGFARRSGPPFFRRAGALVHVAARGVSGAGPADFALFPFAFPRRRHPDRHAAADRLMGDRGGRDGHVRLDGHGDRLPRLSRRTHGSHGRAAGGDGDGLRGSPGRRARPGRRGREQARARPEFVRGQAHRTHVPAGPGRTAQRDRRRARRGDGRAQSVFAQAWASGGVPVSHRCTGRDPGFRASDAGRRGRRRGARLRASPGPQSRAPGGQASSGR